MRIFKIIHKYLLRFKPQQKQSSNSEEQILETPKAENAFLNYVFTLRVIKYAGGGERGKKKGEGREDNGRIWKGKE